MLILSRGHGRRGFDRTVHKTGSYGHCRLLSQSSCLQHQGGNTAYSCRSHSSVMSTQIVSELSTVPVTVSRPVPKQDLDDVIRNPGAPRANVAVSRDNPDGKSDSTQFWKKKDQKTVLQQHVDLWTDENGCVTCPKSARRRIVYALTLTPKP